MNTNNIVIYNDGLIYKIDKEPFETNKDVYKRGWYIINNYNSKDIKTLISESIMELNKNKGMDY
jgi:hypothetical protein|tara:strand:- start:111 stop:302 length:192 start_codon:yes stop_codon:yes gene_type:complete